MIGNVIAVLVFKSKGIAGGFLVTSVFTGVKNTIDALAGTH